MQIQEIILVLAAVPVLIFALLPAANRPKPAVITGFTLLPLVPALLLVVQGIVRWQMVPAYLVVGLLVLARLLNLLKRQPIPIWLRVLGSGAGLFLLGLALLLGTLFPAFNLPPPPGPYQTGTQTLYFPRNDAPGYMVQVWYPVDEVSAAHAPYFDNPARARALGRRYGLPFLFSHAHLIGTNSQPDAPLMTTPGSYPVVLFSHDRQRSRFSSSLLTEALASFGYVVFAPDHPGDALDMVYPDGSLWTPDALTQTPAQASARRAEDLAFVWSQIQALNNSGPFAGALDLTRMAVIGHGLGGMAALRFCGQEAACQAAVDLNSSRANGDQPWWGDDIDSLGRMPAVMVMDEESALPTNDLDRLPDLLRLEAPSGQSARFARQHYGQPVTLFHYLQAHSRNNLWLRVDGAVDAEFSDEALWSPLLIPRLEPGVRSGYLVSDEAQAAVRDFSVVFLNVHVYGSMVAEVMQRGFEEVPEVKLVTAADIDRLQAALDDLGEM